MGRAILAGAPVETTLRWPRTSVELQDGAGWRREARLIVWRCARNSDATTIDLLEVVGDMEGTEVNWGYGPENINGQDRLCSQVATDSHQCR
jgi:hypothetical protein